MPRYVGHPLATVDGVFEVSRIGVGIGQRDVDPICQIATERCFQAFGTCTAVDLEIEVVERCALIGCDHVRLVEAVDGHITDQPTVLPERLPTQLGLA